MKIPILFAHARNVSVHHRKIVRSTSQAQCMRTRLVQSVQFCQQRVRDRECFAGSAWTQNIFFCPWHEPRLAYTQKRATCIREFSERRRRRWKRVYTLSQPAALPVKPHPSNKTDVHEQSTDIIYGKVRSYTNPHKNLG